MVADDWPECDIDSIDVPLPPKRRYVAEVEIVGRISRAEALRIARRILEQAERERGEAAELEAASDEALRHEGE